MKNTSTRNKVLLALIVGLIVLLLALTGAYLLNQKGDDSETKQGGNATNTATNKKEEDLPKVEPDLEADPVKAPEGSLLEGKTLAPPPATD